MYLMPSCKSVTSSVYPEVLLEYEEKFLEFWGADVTTNLLGTLLTASNSSLHSIFYNFLLVHGDADDNKLPTPIYLGAPIIWLLMIHSYWY